jgi:hypothetical protein
MNRIATCAACELEKRNVRTRIAQAHTCFKGEVKYVAPDERTIGDGLYYKIIISRKLWDSGRATKYNLKAQIINGHKVKPGTEIWIPNHLHYMDENIQNISEKRIWVDKAFYEKLLFL